MTTNRSRMILWFPSFSLFLCDPPCRLWWKRRRDGLLWIFAAWFHVGIKI